MTNILNKDNEKVYNYLRYVVERSKITKKKQENQPAPLTTDPVLAKYRFTNVYREQDRYSMEEIRRMTNKPLFEQLKLIVVGRLILNWETYDKVINATSVQEIDDYWKYCQVNGKEFIGAAISFYPPKGETRATVIWKHINQFKEHETELYKVIINPKNNAQYITSKLCQLFTAIGPFRAYEIYTSLTYSKHLTFTEYDHVHLGPGAIDGLTYLLGTEPPETTVTALLVDLAAEIREMLIQEPDFVWANVDDHKFTPRTFEDTLCEYRKYVNLKNGSGRRRKYTPKTNSNIYT